MHEAHLMRDLMAKIAAVAAAEGAARVTRVSVWLGALSHMSEAHFAEHFRDSAAGTLAEGAALDVTMSEDPAHPAAQDILLQSVEVEA